MPHRISPIIDSVVATFVVSITSILTLLMAISTNTPDAEELKLLLIPLIGSMIVSGGAIMLNPTLEDRKVVVGRSVVALFFGAITPQCVAIVFPNYATVLSHAVILFGFGGAAAGVVYILSRPLFEGAYRRSRVTAEFILRKGEEQFRGNVKRAVESVVKDSVVPMVDERIVKPINQRADDIISNQATISNQIQQP